MINYICTSLPSTASLLSLQGAMRSKEGCPSSGLGWVLHRAGTEPQLVLPLSTKGSDYGSCAHCLLVVPLENYLPASSGGHSKGTGARKGGT